MMSLTLNDKKFKSVSGLKFKTYSNATHEFFCFANPGTGVSDAFWKVFRLTIADDTIEWADGNDNYDNVATDLSTVAGLSYS